MSIYTHAKISENGPKILEFYEQSPKIYDDGGFQITNTDYLRSFGFLPVIYTTYPEIDQNKVYAKETFDFSLDQKTILQIYTEYAIENCDINRDKNIITYNPQDTWVFNEELKTVSNVLNITPKLLDDFVLEKRVQINNIRTEKIFSDIEYQFSDHLGHIQLRDEIDLRNITALGVEVLQDTILSLTTATSGDIAKTYVYCDVENIVNSLNNTEMLDVVSTVKNHVQQMYNVSWYHKEYINNIVVAGRSENKSEEQIMDDILAYDLSANW